MAFPQQRASGEGLQPGQGLTTTSGFVFPTLGAGQVGATAAGGLTLGSTTSSTTPGITGGGLKLGSLGTPSTGGIRPGLPTQLNLSTQAPGALSSGLMTAPLGQRLPGMGSQTGLTGLSTLTTAASSGLTGMTASVGLPSYTTATTLSGLSTSTTTGLTGLNARLGAPGSIATATTSLTGSTTGLTTLGGVSTAATGLTGLVSKPLGTGLTSLTCTTAPGLSLTGQTTLTGTLPTNATSTSVGVGVAGAVAGGGKKYTYRELEDLVNRWSRELQDQERMFLQQAGLVGQWDSLLQKNGERIISLHEEVERIVTEQKRLDNELDLIDTQQNELEDVLSQLEASLTALPSLSSSQHADIEREHTYGLVKRIDSQLAQMGKDLTDVIEQMNAAGSSDQEDDHMSQIVQILNAHADTLNWIDRNTVLVQQKVDQVSTMVERQRYEHERSFHMAFGQSV